MVYGHTPVPEPEWLNRTISTDTGCVFGGKLTALRYPEKELVSVPAKETYAQPAKPFLAEASTAPLSAQHQNDNLLDMEDVLGKRIVSTRLCSNLTIREENATAALEVMSRFASNPKWLIYLPPNNVDLGNHPGTGFAGASPRGFRVLPPRGRSSSHLRAEAHGLAGGRHRLPG